MIKVIMNGKLHNYEQSLKPKVMRTDRKVRSKWYNKRFDENLYYLDFKGVIIFIPEEYVSEFKNGYKYDLFSSNFGLIKRNGLLYLSKHNMYDTFIIIVNKYSNTLAKDTVDLIDLNSSKRVKSKFYTKVESWPMVPQKEEKRFLNTISAIFKNPKMLHLYNSSNLGKNVYINYNSVTRRVEIQQLNSGVEDVHIKQIMIMKKSLFETIVTKK